MSGSLFERVGGFARVRLMVSDFYEKVLASERLSPYFEHVDMRQLIDHQARLFTAIMGGPASFTNEHLARVHARMRISGEEFEEMAGLFRETLEDAGLEDSDVTRLHAHVLSLRDHIVAESDVTAAR